MDQREQKLHPSLPPDYVSFAQLRERWLQKQQHDKEMKAKQAEEDERKQRESKIQNENQTQEGMKNDGPMKYECEIEDKGRGKDIAIGGSEIGEENKTNKKKNKKKMWKKKKSKGKKNGEKEMLKSETGEEFDGGDWSEIVPQNEVKLGINGGLKGVEKIVCVKGGDNRGSGDKRNKVYRVKSNGLKENEVQLDLEEKKMEGKQGYAPKEWRQRTRNNRVKKSGQDVSKQELEKKDEDENLKVCSGNKNESECLNDKMVATEKKADNKVLAVESPKNVELGNGPSGGYRRYGNNGRRFGGLASDDRKMDGGDRRRNKRHGVRFGGGSKTKQRESGMVWVKKGDMSRVDDDAQVGYSGISVDQK